MSSELLMRMLETIDDVSMVKEPTRAVSRMQRIEALSDGCLSFSNGSNPVVLDALQVSAAAGARPRRVCDRSRAPAVRRSRCW